MNQWSDAFSSYKLLWWSRRGSYRTCIYKIDWLYPRISSRGGRHQSIDPRLCSDNALHCSDSQCSISNGTDMWGCCSGSTGIARKLLGRKATVACMDKHYQRKLQQVMTTISASWVFALVDGRKIPPVHASGGSRYRWKLSTLWCI